MLQLPRHAGVCESALPAADPTLRIRLAGGETLLLQACVETGTYVPCHGCAAAHRVYASARQQEHSLVAKKLKQNFKPALRQRSMIR